MTTESFTKAEDEIQALADELFERARFSARPITREAAFATIVSENPDLYEQYNAQMRLLQRQAALGYRNDVEFLDDDDDDDE